MSTGRYTANVASGILDVEESTFGNVSEIMTQSQALSHPMASTGDMLRGDSPVVVGFRIP